MLTELFLCAPLPLTLSRWLELLQVADLMLMSAQALLALPANKRQPIAKAVHSRQNRAWFEVRVIVDIPTLRSGPRYSPL
jgi:hypothetical protein